MVPQMGACNPVAPPPEEGIAIIGVLLACGNIITFDIS